MAKCLHDFGHLFSDVPGPPRGPLEVGEITNTSIHIAWKPPSHNGGLPIKSYYVERREEGDRDWVTGRIRALQAAATKAKPLAETLVIMK